MRIQRDWVTPIAAGSFLISAVTGLLLFFHVDLGLGKLAHEWLSWVLLGGVALHSVANWPALKRHLLSRVGQSLVAISATLLVLSLVVGGGRGKRPEQASAAALRALAAAPLSTLAQLAHLNLGQLNERLLKAGLQAGSEQQTLGQLVGDDQRRQTQALGAVFEKGTQTPGPQTPE